MKTPWVSCLSCFLFWVGILLTSKTYAEPLTFEKAESLRRQGDHEQLRQILNFDGFSHIDPAETLIEAAEIFREYGDYAGAASMARYVNGNFAAENIAILGDVRRILKETGNPDEAKDLLARINEIAIARKEVKDDFLPEELIRLGEIAAESRVDPVRVYDQFYKPALKKNPKLLRGYLAAADLALRNRDFQYATELLKQALKKYGKHAEIHSRMAIAYYESGYLPLYYTEIANALAINPTHIPTLLLQAERAIFLRDFKGADRVLGQIFSLDTFNPRGRALQAVKYQHRKQFDLADKARTQALKYRPSSADVDYWIGSALGRMLLFNEAIPFLISAYETDSNLIEAKAELALAYLRRGDEEKGWQVMEEVHAEDPFNIVAYNYTELRPYLNALVIIETPHFKIRIPQKDRDIYGGRILEILNRARTEMIARYGHTPAKQTAIDFFTQTQDFNIRLTGIPGGLGILGACFGDVITMQSAGSVGMIGNNWEETLWHEYAHTVTLNATDQRIPRWLTEGCSVHEEGLFGPHHRRSFDMSLQQSFANGLLISFEDLNTNFMGSGIKLAYFQSGRMVDHIVKKHGYKKLSLVLVDLGKGTPIDDAFAAHLEPVASFMTEFAAIAKNEAESVAPGLDWRLPENPAVLKRDTQALKDYLVEHPNNYWALKLQCGVHMRLKDWVELEKTANHLIKLHPSDGTSDCARYYLSLVARYRFDTTYERQLLVEWMQYVSDAVYAAERLIEIDTQNKRWSEVVSHSQYLIGVEPMTHLPHRGMGDAYEVLDKPELAIASYEKLLLTDQINPARTHYRLGLLRSESDPDRARQHALDAISEAPRYRDAHRLFRNLADKQ